MIWTNLAVYNPNLWMLVELWAWNRSERELVDRTASPWDDPTRRSSHADRRKTLRAQIMRTELLTLAQTRLLPQTIIRLAERFVALAA